MINKYLLTKEEVDKLVISLDWYYKLSFTKIGVDSGASVYEVTEVAKKMLKILARENVLDINDEDFVLFLSSNQDGLVKFCKHFDVMFAYPGTPSSKISDYEVRIRKYIENKVKYINLGSGFVKNKSWGHQLSPFILDGSLFDKRAEGIAIRDRYERFIYEMVLDYIYFCFVNREIVEPKDMNYEGIEILDDFDVSVAKMFLEYYDDMNANPVKLVSGGKEDTRGVFELFKEGIREYSKESRGYLVQESIRHFEFQKDFIRANWYGIQEMLKLDGLEGVKEKEFLRNLFFVNAKNASEDKRGRVLATIVRFVDYALSGCYI